MKLPFPVLHDLQDAERNFDQIDAHGIWDDTTPTQALAAAFGQLLSHPGDLKMSAVPITPTGWLLCDGASYLRSAQPTLFAAIGTTYGSADGTHFNVPDLRGRVPVGAGTGTAAGATAHALGSQPTSGGGGEETHTLSVAEMPSHNHGGATGTGTTGADANYPSSNVYSAGGAVLFVVHTYNGAFIGADSRKYQDLSHNHSVPALAISSQGGGTAHNIMQPVSTVNYFIKT